jgi:NTP pyrophosphatase (non-canonical NTP hydrolase)
MDNPVDWDEYQRWCVEGVLPSTHTPQLPLIYPTLGLVGEAGEFADKVKKLIRDGNVGTPRETETELAKELGDVLWYLAVCADYIGFDLSTVMEMNMEKLNKRREEGKVHGSGDNR